MSVQFFRARRNAHITGSVMGPSGSGKSTVCSLSRLTISTLTSQQFIEYATTNTDRPIPQSHTSEIQVVRTNHPADNGSVVFIDAPSFDESNWEIETLAEFASWFDKV